MENKINNKDFVHLHVHSEFSKFDGLATINDLVTHARKMGFPALALTDHGNVGGFIKFIKACRATKDKKDNPIEYAPIKPILGAELYLARNHLSKGKAAQPDERKGNRHIVLLAKNWDGYQNLCQLSQTGFVDGFWYDPRIDFGLLSKHSKGLICSTACLGSVVNINLVYGRYKQAKQAASMLKDIFGEDFFMEIMFHGIYSEKYIADDIFKISKELDVPVIATNDCHYIEKKHAKAQEVLMCMSSSKCIHDPKRPRLPTEEFYLKSAAQMLSIFKHTPQVISNTVALAERIDTEDIEKHLFGGMRLPKFDIPEKYNTPYEYLKDLAVDGVKRLKWDKSKPHVDALKKELIDVRVALDNNNYDFATYFLIVRDIIQFAKSKGIMCGAGRGSGYASVLLRCLGITHGVDPLNYELLWERFLGFQNSKFVKSSDFFNEQHTYTKIYTGKQKQIRSEITSAVKVKDSTILKKVESELDIMETTEGIHDVNNLENFYHIWKDSNGQSGTKNEINSWTAWAIGLTSKKPDENAEFLPDRRVFARAGFPDIDMDFDYFYQNEIYDYIVNKYGREFVGNIGTYQDIKLKSAITRIGKVLDVAGSFHKGREAYVSDNEAKIREIIDSSLPKGGVVKARDEKGNATIIKTVKQAYEHFKDFRFYMDKYKDLYQYSQDIEGISSVFGCHPAGIVISDVPLGTIAPMRRAKEASLATQYDMKDLESIGLIKMDILALSTLTVIAQTVKMIENNYGIKIDVENLPIEDEKTYELFRRGNLTGVFQCEQPGMQHTMRDINVDSFDDIMAAIALYRPGPMGSIPNYCSRKKGEASIDYFHSSIEPYVKKYLEKTYGVLVYQEQVMQICNSLANFSILDGYVLIKGIGKKEQSLIDKFEKKFIKGCCSNNVPEAVAKTYWDKFITPFASYGFNAAHSCCYAYLAYTTAYLKANYPDEFFCCYLNVENLRKKQDKIDELLKEMKKFDIILGEKDINSCEEDYKIVNKKDELQGIAKTVINPSIMCKGMGYNVAKEISLNKPYNSLRELASKTTSSVVNQDAVGALVDGGFFTKQFKEANKGKKKEEKISLEKFRDNVQEKFASIKKDLKSASKKGVNSIDIFE